jgi:hypothetical protein
MSLANIIYEISSKCIYTGLYSAGVHKVQFEICCTAESSVDKNKWYKSNTAQTHDLRS